MSRESAAGRLVLVPTPIGNLADITLRALEALRDADVIYAEDTRVTGKLLSALDIERDSAGERVPLVRCDDNVAAQKAAEVVERISAGETVAFCSDAGMPGVSDPGAVLVAAVREAGLPVDVLPGPNAAATAYVASGFDCPRFYFGGFFPRREPDRKSLLESLGPLDAALIFYESPKRIASALASVAQTFPHRKVAVCRELTKLHEEVFVASTVDAAGEFARREESGGIKGEIAFVVGPPTEAERKVGLEESKVLARARAVELACAGESQKAITRILCEEFGVPRNDAYEIALWARSEIDG